uniref:hypothetical protein n=1 Tax=Agathobacter sp. TaxID=2021311 RepID=UPI004055D248
MIEIVTNKERNLRNVTQIGTPREENKVYIENLAYTRLKDEAYDEKNVFVLMGHTECTENRYITFIEAVIPVNTIEFSGNLPKWNDYVWKDVFREVKRLHEDMIIVGWALDIKGMSQKPTPELERIHREHFGGIHQLLLLMDTLEDEQTFYVQKGNVLTAKDGFYIYYCTRTKTETSDTYENDSHLERIPITRKRTNYEQRNGNNRYEERNVRQEKRVIQIQDYGKQRYEQEEEIPSVDLSVDMGEWSSSRGGKYRQMLKENEKKKKSASGSNVGIAVAAAMLVFVVGVGIYENKEALWEQADKAVESLSKNAQAEDTQTEETETATQTDTIPIDTVSGETP